MGKFKVGDKVKRVEDVDVFIARYGSDTGTVSEVDDDGWIRIEKLEHHQWDEDKFQLIDDWTIYNNDKPVFTQAMADAGELPPVGSFVSLNYDRKGCPEDLNLDEHCVVDCWERDSALEVIAHTLIKGCVLPVVKFNDQVSAILLEHIKPIDTRTPEQKAVDEGKFQLVDEWTIYNNDKPLSELSDEQVGKLALEAPRMKTHPLTFNQQILKLLCRELRRIRLSSFNLFVRLILVSRIF